MPVKPSTKYIAVYMADEAIETLKSLAQKKGYKAVGEYVRDLIKLDVQREGLEIDFGLDSWGGKGRRSSTQDENK